MSDKIDKKALEYHEGKRAGKIEVTPTKPYSTPEELSLAYSPGVAAPAAAINKERWQAYRYTNKGNLVAIISNGSALLGLGNTGALSAKPVMEGKSMLFKIYMPTLTHSILSLPRKTPTNSSPPCRIFHPPSVQ